MLPNSLRGGGKSRKLASVVHDRRAEAVTWLHDVIDTECDPAEFLATLQIGVALIGADYFHVTSATVADANDRDQLRPHFDVIARSLPAMSSG